MVHVRTYVIGCVDICVCVYMYMYVYVHVVTLYTRNTCTLHHYMYLLQQCDDLQYQVLMESLVRVQPKL